MRKWTQESAAKCIKNGQDGLMRCSAMDYYRKEFGAVELNKLLSGNAPKQPQTTKVAIVEDKSEENTKNTQTEKQEKTFEKKEKPERKQYAFSRSIGSEWGYLFSKRK